jgi:tRNA A-37 threonylcarbamoyl transferase component Bud32
MDELAAARAGRSDAGTPSLSSVVRSALAASSPDADEWTVRMGRLWCGLRPPGHAAPGQGLPDQGWKLHLSATPLTVAEMLARAVPVLVARRCEFKFAADLATVRWLTSRGCARAAAGKVVTAYPRDDAEFRALVADLDAATDGLAGPAILSDRRHRPGSVVHYRYGSFRPRLTLDDDGLYRPMLSAPDGTQYEDRRMPWFTPPSWIAPPYPAPAPAHGRSRAAAERGSAAAAVPGAGAAAPPGAGAAMPGAGTAAVPRAGAAAVPGAGAAAPGPVRIGGRYLALDAIQHSTRGGVFRGRDEQTGNSVIIRQARAYVEVDPDGRDARDRLRAEAELLRALPASLVPRLLAVVEDPDQSFLVRSPAVGPTLRQWVAMHRDTGGVPLGSGLAMARTVIRLFRALHQEDLVVVDVSPSNLVVEQSGALRLIDLEHAQRAGEVGFPAGTPGYTAPEHLLPTGPDEHPQPVPIRPRSDVFGVGGLLFLLATGMDPVLAPDDPPARSTMDRMRAWLTALAPVRPLAHRLTPIILGTMRSAPASRWDLALAQRQLTRHEQVGRRQPRTGTEQDRLIAHGVGHLVDRLDPTERRLWPDRRPAPPDAAADPCAVQHGAAGVLGALVRAAPYADDRPAARAAIGMTARWIVDRLPDEPRLLPGLYFGRAGTAWALHDAAALLDDPAFAAVGTDLALRLPLARAAPDQPGPDQPGPDQPSVDRPSVDRPSPDVAHGLAGAGLAQLRLWQLTGDPRFGHRARQCADTLVSTVDTTGGQVCWPIPAGLRSVLAGKTYNGFAHGTAGIGSFLLAAGTLTRDWRYTDLAGAAAESLVRAASVTSAGARWPVHPDGLQWADAGWCTGSAGIGGFLLQVWQRTGAPRPLEVALSAARTVYESRFYAPSSACHGLASGGQFLLDISDAVDERRYRTWATDLAGVLAARAARRGGRLVVPDESGAGFLADYSVGVAGTLEFLVRLRHGGPAPWQVGPQTPRRPAVRHHRTGDRDGQ